MYDFYEYIQCEEIFRVIVSDYCKLTNNNEET